MNVMIMMCVEQGALNSPVIRMILHCQGPMLPSPARIWSPSSLSLPASSSTSPMVTAAGHTCKRYIIVQYHPTLLTCLLPCVRCCHASRAVVTLSRSCDPGAREGRAAWGKRRDQSIYTSAPVMHKKRSPDLQCPVSSLALVTTLCPAYFYFLLSYIFCFLCAEERELIVGGRGEECRLLSYLTM